MMNTGAEANETAIKAARKWGYKVKGVAADQAKIIVMHGNFHGRTTTIMSFSDDENARDGFGPFTPGFVKVPFGDADAIEVAIDDNTVAVLLEPIQGEGGVVVPPEGYLKRVREITQRNNVLMICDEVQTGMGRTGTPFRFQVEGILPDIVTCAKSLSAGLYPVSAVLGSNEVMAVFTPGTHGSTFGGNPVATALGKAVCDELATGKWQAHAEELHPVLFDGLRALLGRGLTEVRGVALWAGVDIDPTAGTGGMLLVAARALKEPNPDIEVNLAGQELMPTGYAIGKADLLIQGGEPDAIRHGETLLTNLYEGKQFEYILSNPPFGSDWSVQQSSVKEQAKVPGSRFSHGLPNKGDGQMLFLAHVVSKGPNPDLSTFRGSGPPRHCKCQSSRSD